MPRITASHLSVLQGKPKQIRNICILAHVDHGKTTLTDSLICSNGIISSKIAGKVRYMDYLEDEQQRGITMKSASISLLHVQYQDGVTPCPENGAMDPFLVNVVDSPGHVDFSGEVSTAVRLTDGALVLVDAVEGVCTQTHAVLRQAYEEGVKLCLVINKIDRLITELRMTPEEAYRHMRNIVGQVNVICSTLFTAELMAEAARRVELNSTDTGVLEDKDETNLYFSPDNGNVVFSSAVDGWGFRIDHFAELYSRKLGVKREVLQRTLWGDYFFQPKEKKVVSKDPTGRLKPMFVQFVLSNIWAVYKAVEERNREQIDKIVTALELKVPPRELAQKDEKQLLSSIFSRWLPLANAILSTVVNKLPNPIDAQRERADKLFRWSPEHDQAAVRDAVMACAAGESDPTVVFVAKMISVRRDALPSARPANDWNSPEAIATRERLRKERMDRQASQPRPTEAKTEDLDWLDKRPAKADDLQFSVGQASSTHAQEDSGESSAPKDSSAPAAVPETVSAPTAPTAPASSEPKTGEVFVGFARVFCGRLRVGQEVHVLGPKFDPKFPTKHHKVITVGEVYLFMGRALEHLDVVPAGNICGIGGLEGAVLKTATLTTDMRCPLFTTMRAEAAPIVRVAVEPESPLDMPALVQGLKALYQADPVVQVMQQETGEHVILAAGELHLQVCVKDLQERYARVKLRVSPPIVSFRETTIDAEAPPGLDDAQKLAREGFLTVETPLKECTIQLRVQPLPVNVLNYLETNAQLYRQLASGGQESSEKEDDVLRYTEGLKAALAAAGGEWPGRYECIRDIGGRRTFTNILLNSATDFKSLIEWHDLGGRLKGKDATKAIAVTASDVEEREELDVETISDVSASVVPDTVPDDTADLQDNSTQSMARAADNGIVTGFQLAAQAGPLCDEPLTAVCVNILSVTLNPSAVERSFHGQLIATVKDGIRDALLARPMRLVEAMYSCSIQASADVLGNVYDVVGKRRGRMVKEEMREGTNIFEIDALLPVASSFGFSESLRTQTSGAAFPQLVFSHWETLDVDPFYVPQTEDEIEEFGETDVAPNIARDLINSVRRRKGLFVREQIVKHAEKQRTFKRNK